MGLRTWLGLKKAKPGRVPLVDGAYGIRFPAAPVISRTVRSVVRRGLYEVRESHLALDLVAEGSRVLELGAGIGLISALICTRKNVASYDAVEADERLIPVLRETWRLNGVENVRLHYGIVTSDRESLVRGTRRMAHGKQFCENSTKRLGEGRTEIDIPTLSFADLLAEIRPDTLLVDIEGEEATLFEGMNMDCIRLAIVELHPDIIGAAGADAAKAALARAGLTLDRGLSAGPVVVYRT